MSVNQYDHAESFSMESDQLKKLGVNMRVTSLISAACFVRSNPD